jgi:hypothetical protein
VVCERDSGASRRIDDTHAECTNANLKCHDSISAAWHHRQTRYPSAANTSSSESGKRPFASFE